MSKTIHKDLKIDDVFNIIGRGLVFVVEIERTRVDNLPFSKGDSVLHGGATYEIIGIEIIQNAIPYPTTTNCGLLVKPIVDEEE